jgi:hypothetical protein
MKIWKKHKKYWQKTPESQMLSKKDAINPTHNLITPHPHTHTT